MKIITLLMCLGLFGCATVPPVKQNKYTSSGLPERTFTNTTVDAVRSVLIDRCYSRKLQVEELSQTVLTCSRELEGGEALIVQIMLGNSYADIPRGTIKYQLLKANDSIKLIVVPTYSTRMINGKINSQQITDQKVLNAMQDNIDAIIIP